MARRRNRRPIFYGILVYVVRADKYNNASCRLEPVLKARIAHALADADSTSIHGQAHKSKSKSGAHVSILQRQSLDPVRVRRTAQPVVGSGLTKFKFHIS